MRDGSPRRWGQRPSGEHPHTNEPTNFLQTLTEMIGSTAEHPFQRAYARVVTDPQTEHHCVGMRALPLLFRLTVFRAARPSDRRRDLTAKATRFCEQHLGTILHSLRASRLCQGNRSNHDCCRDAELNLPIQKPAINAGTSTRRQCTVHGTDMPRPKAERRKAFLPGTNG